MCFGLEAAWLPAVLGAGFSMAGTAVQQKQQERQQQDIANARNEVLRDTMRKNDKLAAESRDAFNKRMADASAEQMAADQQKAQDTRTAELEAAATNPTPETSAAESAPLAGAEANVVKSDLAERMKAVLEKGKAQAAAHGKLGAYGDNWLEQGFRDTQAGRDIGTLANKAAGNSAIMPYAQDFAEHAAYRPISPIGGILQGIGGMLGSYGGGSGTALPRKTYSTPFIGGP